MIQDIAPHRLCNEYRAEAVPAAGEWVFFVRGEELALRRVEGDEPSFELPCVGAPGVPAEGLTYLFALDGRSVWLAPEAGLAEVPAGYELVSHRVLRREGRGPRELVYASFTAVHLAGWYATNRRCGRCGEALVPHASLRALACPACGNLIFPRLNPAVIVCVRDPKRERIVITRYVRSRKVPVDALVAGFVEIGETLEECVRREVREELGLEVDNISYYKSQPWGIAGDVLMGFWCDVVGDPTIRFDEQELCRAAWRSPEEIAGQPDDLSLTNEMMCVWRDEHLKE